MQHYNEWKRLQEFRRRYPSLLVYKMRKALL
jgi:hypothetical protein